MSRHEAKAFVLSHPLYQALRGHPRVHEIRLAQQRLYALGFPPWVALEMAAEEVTQTPTAYELARWYALPEP